ncbi:enoyl-CoA hydratase/isomerase family protein [Sphingomonas sp.]|uniref:enoyl-CoA hydratase/isomerase family protein n=1 Tax=Sphingomonas sp. TaxID=28214 RepID=UPI0025FDE9DF|nr:enoyl-CoA hydratase/isomerase family protein [Sphingomonas sp.]
MTGTNDDPVLVRVDGKVGRIGLNRPQALHALTLPMCEAMRAALNSWRDDAAVEAVIIDHTVGRGFCAGGDIRAIADGAARGGADAKRFFLAEYRLNHKLFTYGKPVIAFMDGITMGGGVGISQPARYRIATENTRFAMPETGIGLFPDVGGGWYLSRLRGRVGAYLALTGARLDGAECLALGLATHYLPAAALLEAKTQIAANPGDVAAILANLSITPPAPSIMADLPMIDRLFAADTYEAILTALDDDGSDWGRKQAAILRPKSPQACKVALRQLATGAALTDFADDMRMEYRIASRVAVLPDFAEGVRAVIVDKDNAPVWNPSTPEGVTPAMLDAIFAPLPDNQEWTPS